jgi:hypothetical protein
MRDFSRAGLCFALLACLLPHGCGFGGLVLRIQGLEAGRVQGGLLWWMGRER